ncbi:toxin-antitoxin system HicB family antitoxin [Pseudonocardia endophytica]|uniref:HicB-like protein involved in pilus formation n=1 Tax=Pseudonocardia endophytica TaxID=401976 RepID=A0A4R1HRS6_PSEEN|nr:toxin-antitoxin system HicB family antitoxin [Pseudonocardia endophytica]TCK25324.1 HicB-like protein involved in pilus formation [Pseudonocardia endophytica]
MDLTPYVAQLRDDLATAASAGDEQTRRTAALLGSAIEPAARLALMNALSDLAAEVTASLGDRTVDLRLDGRDVQVSVGGAPTSAQEEPRRSTEQTQQTGPFGPDAGDISRVTLRIVEQIKGQAEQAAQQQGVSLNTWVAQAVQGALSGAAQQRGQGRPGRPGQGPDDDGRLRGWVQG